MAQALVEFLEQQYVSMDGKEEQFFAGCYGIFGHGNVAGLGQALHQRPSFPYTLFRNEQGLAHAAAAFARMANRKRTIACTASVGPGSTNMITAAAGATINRVPILCLPGDIFARRKVAPVLQQLESASSQDVSVNDCFKPISKYWDRISRPEQLITSLPEAMRVLTSPADTGAVTLSLPQDVQADAFDYPVEFFRKRVWVISRPRPDRALLDKAVSLIRGAKKPLIVAGGGLIYSEATGALAKFVEKTGIAVAESQAGKGSLPWDHAQSLGAVGTTGTRGANRLARDADVVIGIGTRYADFTTASKTAFQHPNVHFINVNITDFDACKHSGLAVVSDAKTALEELLTSLSDYKVSKDYQAFVQTEQEFWTKEVDRIYHMKSSNALLNQGAVLGAVNEFQAATGVMVCAAGSMPGDLHKLWRTRDPKGYHVEYGFSCMGYEVAGGVGVAMAAPDREVTVLVGDGSWLMMSQEVVTAVQEDVKLLVVLVDNHGFASIGNLSKGVGCDGFGTKYRKRTATGLNGDHVPVDFVANARSLGAHSVKVTSIGDLKKALEAWRGGAGVHVIVCETDRSQRVGGYESWWDVPIAEVSTAGDVKKRRLDYEPAAAKERYFL